MTTQIKRRRGTTTQHASFTGAEGELTIDTTKDTVVVHDGSTAGGHPLAKASEAVAKSGDTMTGDLTTTGLNVNGDLSVYAANSRMRLYETDTTDLNTQLQNQAGDFNIARLDDDAGNSTVQLNIDHATGNVSIPNGNLDVTGTVTADGLTVDNVDINGATVAWQNGGTNQTYFSTTGSSEQALILRLDNQNLSSAGYFEVQDGSAGRKLLTVEDGGDISFYEDTGTTPKFFWDASAETLSIGTYNSSGTPSGSLFVDSNANNHAIHIEETGGGSESWQIGVNTDGDLGFYNSQTTTASVSFDDSGSVGIGTSSPATSSGYTSLALNGSSNSGWIQLMSGGTSVADWYSSGGTENTLRSLSGAFNFTISGQDVFKFSSGSAERLRIDASGNLLVGKTASSNTTNGTTISPEYGLQNTITTASGAFQNLFLNRQDADGDFIAFRKANSPVGSIGSNSGTNMIMGTGATGIYFNNASQSVHPWNISANQARSGARDLGLATDKFRNIYINGSVTFGDGHFIGNGNGDNLEVVSGASENILLKSAGGIISFNDASGSNEYARFDPSGNLLVSKTALNTNTVGLQLESDGYLSACRDGGNVALINRKTSDGALVTFQKDGSTVGSIFSSGGIQMGIGDGDTGLLFGDNIDAIMPWSTSNTQRDNTTDLGRSITRFKDLYLSGGVYLGGTVAANKLDDYEEGTWTPTLTSGYTSPTYSIQMGRYTKIGNIVRAYFRVKMTGGTANATNVVIGGLPYTSLSDGSQYPVGTGYINLSAAYADVFMGLQFQASTEVRLYRRTTTANATLTGNDLGNALDILYQVIYMST